MIDKSGLRLLPLLLNVLAVDSISLVVVLSDSSLEFLDMYSFVGILLVFAAVWFLKGVYFESSFSFTDNSLLLLTGLKMLCPTNTTISISPRRQINVWKWFILNKIDNFNQLTWEILDFSCVLFIIRFAFSASKRVSSKSTSNIMNNF